MFKSFPFYPQFDEMDCGPACLQMIANFFGKEYSLGYLREQCYLTKDGVSLLGISQAAETIGIESISVKLGLETLLKEKFTPIILHWNENHFVVLHQIKKTWRGHYLFKIADPRYGLITLTQAVFEQNWTGGKPKGIALILNPTDVFYAKQEEKLVKTVPIKTLYKYFKPYKVDLIHLSIGLLGGSLITLIFPFLTQLLIDKGVAFKSLNIIFLILLGQLFLFLGSSFIEIIRNWVLLHIGTRTNIAILSNFLSKLTQLPLSFFDSKRIGDFMQRIEDHHRIEDFLTSQSLFTFFSLINFIVFLAVLAFYNLWIILVYLSLTLVAVGWMFLFYKQRRLLDFTNFAYRSENQSSILELLNGMQEIKLNNFETYKQNEWEDIQIKLFINNMSILRIDQYQLVGYNFINQFKNIVVTFIAAQQVVLGNISLGAMLSITYIVGQMNSPIEQLIAFFRSLQDTQLSLERLEEINQKRNEEQAEHLTQLPINPSQKGIQISDLSFRYEGPQSIPVLKNLNLFIPEGNVTAIVGASGSGKTTLMKLLLKFYPINHGEIKINGSSLEQLSPKWWRQNCGTVLQDGFIFSDTIARNIATNELEIDPKKLEHAIKMANLEPYVGKLPLGVLTKIGANSSGLSGGEKQRILIARAIYKNPTYLFFDEATSALDADNEKIIMNNLNHFFQNKTVFIIAHRLSTVKNAQQIIVLNKGEIVEQGNHKELVALKGHYFHLVKNQLELGS
jgi:ATP-binding cassette subfamily B protein